MRTRIIALLLTGVMTVSLLPVSALALESSDNNTAAQETTVATAPEEFAAMAPDGDDTLTAETGAVPAEAYAELTAEEKQTAIWRIQALYEEYLKQLEEKEAAFEESGRGIWLAQMTTGREQLDAAREALDRQQATALTALNDCKTPAEADMLTSDCGDAMRQIVEGLQPVVQANNVPEEKKWDGSTRTAPSGGGTEDDPYRIGSGAELAWFSDRVNGGQQTLCARLTADIDLNGHPWTPIGTAGMSYQGTFDGCNSVVNGLSVSGAGYAGLFGVIGKNGTAERLIAAGTISMVSAANNEVRSVGAGGIAGYCMGTIFQCFSSVYIRNDGTNFSPVAGGIAGKTAVNAIVDSCGNYGTVGGRRNVNYAGGIVGVAGQGSVIRYCTNEGAVSGVQGVGGIVGALTDYAQVRLCENRGAVQGDSRVGGIVGWVGQPQYLSHGVLDVRIMNVLNEGPVSGSGSPSAGTGVGGIAGYIGTAGSTGLTGPCELSYAYNTGTAADNGSTAAQGVGGIVGEWYGGEIRHVQSASANTLWGVVDMAVTNSCDTARVATVTPAYTMNGNVWEKVSATARLLEKLIRPESSDERYGIYGAEQSALYNGVVLSYIERIERSEGDADALVQKCDKQLNNVLKGKDASGQQLMEALRAYAGSRVYAAAEQAEVNARLTEAEEEIRAAETIADIADIQLKYLGEDGLLVRIETYPERAQRDLYVSFIAGKKYSQEDMAALLTAYESWRMRLEQATSAEEADILFADAKKALTDLTAAFAEGETAPDMDAAAAAALQNARDAARQELDTLAQQCVAELTLQMGDISDFDAERQKLLNDALERGKSAIETAAAVKLDELNDYAAIRQARQEGLAAIEQAYISAGGKLKKLLDSAHAEDGWDGIAVSQPRGKGTEDEPYQIGTAQELAWLAYAVNNRLESAGFCAVLTADIDLGCCQWPVIGVPGSNGRYAYTGTFDGQGHTVSGLYITALGGRQKLGLFGAAQGAVIEDVTVRGSIELTGVRSYDSSTAGYFIGGLLGSGEGSGVTLRNCVSQVDVSVTFDDVAGAQNSAVGGLAGRLSGSGSHEITDCRNEGRVYTSFAPGSRYLGGTGDGGQGGIVGFIAAGAQLERCANTGAVYAVRAAGVGGIVGNVDAGSKEAVTLDRCANQGAVSNDTGGVLLRKGGTGGIIGLAPAGSITVSSCYNTGTVAGSAIVGGILGGEKGEHASSQSGNTELVLENCYNAGDLQVGTASTLAGSLAGYPIDGRYYTGLTVRKGACRWVMGWKCSQGDSVRESTALTAETLFEGLVDSIGGVNGGYPLFDWQLLERQSREAVVSYLNDRYEREIKPIAAAAQCEEIERLLAETTETIRTAKTTEEMTAAYEKALARMSASDLLAAAKEAAQKRLDALYSGAKRYKDIAEQLNELYETQSAGIAACAASAEMDAALDRFSAGTVDLLIAARGGTGVTMKELSATLPEVTAAYRALTAAQKKLLVNGSKLTEAQNLLAAYECDLESLDQWADSDKSKYSAVRAEIGKLAEETRTKLGSCTDAAGMTGVLNEYSAGVARLLLEKLTFTAGKTTLGELNKLSQVIEQASAAISGLTKEQKGLLDEAQAASCAAAKELLAVYRAAAENLDKWSSEDQSKYSDLKAPLNSLAATARKELEASVDRDGAAKALNRYCAGAVMELITSVGTVKDVMTESEASQIRAKLQRARDAYGALSDDQKKLVTNYAALQAAETAYRTYEQNYAAAKAAEALMGAIGTVTKDSYDAIQKAVEAYNKLTAAQKQLVDAKLVRQLEDASARYKELLEQTAGANGETVPADQLPVPDEVQTEAAQPFDRSIVWISMGILAAAAVITAVARWFVAVRRAKQKKEA